LIDFAKATLAAQQGKGRTPQRRSLLKGKTNSPAGVFLAQRPQMPAGFAGDHHSHVMVVKACMLYIMSCETNFEAKDAVRCISGRLNKL